MKTASPINNYDMVRTHELLKSSNISRTKLDRSMEHRSAYRPSSALVKAEAEFTSRGGHSPSPDSTTADGIERDEAMHAGVTPDDSDPLDESGHYVQHHQTIKHFGGAANQRQLDDWLQITGWHDRDYRYETLRQHEKQRQRGYDSSKNRAGLLDNGQDHLAYEGDSACASRGRNPIKIRGLASAHHSDYQQGRRYDERADYPVRDRLPSDDYSHDYSRHGFSYDDYGRGHQDSTGGGYRCRSYRDDRDAHNARREASSPLHYDPYGHRSYEVRKPIYQDRFAERCHEDYYEPARLDHDGYGRPRGRSRSPRRYDHEAQSRPARDLVSRSAAPRAPSEDPELAYAREDSAHGTASRPPRFKKQGKCEFAAPPADRDLERERRLKALPVEKIDLDGDYDDTRYFIIKSFNYGNIYSSQELGVWATRADNERILADAFDHSKNVILIFSANASRAYQGYARMSSLPSPSNPHPEWLAADAWKMTPPFRVGWLSRAPCADSAAKHLTNPFNRNMAVTRARDCQEVEPRAGRALVGILAKAAARGGGAAGA